MNPTDREFVPLSTRLRCAARAAWACLKADYTVERVPVKGRHPGMCCTLNDCIAKTHQLEQAEAVLDELAGRPSRTAASTDRRGG